MESSDNRWVVRAGRGGRFIDEFIDGGFVGLGHGYHPSSGSLPADPTRESLGAYLESIYPGWKPGKVTNAASQLYRFMVELSVGDTVVTVDLSRRLYVIGTITSAPYLQADADMALRRKVTWTQVAPRDALSVPTRNTLGSILSLFRLADEPWDDLSAHQRPIDQADTPAAVTPPKAPKDLPPDVPEEESSLDGLLHDIQQKSREFIEDRIAALDPDEMEELVAGILRAMGYKTRVSDKGPDRGVDVFASPDGLGLQEPRIFVEVKHRSARMGSQEIRSFLGGRQRGDRCLYVSTGGYTREARYEAERANVPLTLIDLPMLGELLVEHYDAVDIETKQLVPLTRVYWPLDDE
ncbi:MAG: restriction endonuclease [Sandaracinus sp.]|nr:restriction endonuclease [Sandaracinus sp.]